jgi:histidinol-phosphate phosphatase family protein
MKRKAVFFDRDGTLNWEVNNYSPLSPQELKLLPHATEAVKKVNDLGFLVIVVTNQTQAARSILGLEGIEAINEELVKKLEEEGARIDSVHYCPHHPEADVKEYRKICPCRKPNTEMIEKASQEFNIDPEKSFFVGDSTCDILAGKRAGLTTILVKTGRAGTDGKYEVIPDHITKDVLEAAEVIRNHAK